MVNVPQFSRTRKRALFGGVPTKRCKFMSASDKKFLALMPKLNSRRVDVLLTVSTPTPPVPPPPPPNPERCKQCVEDFLNSRLEGNEKIARLQACLASNRCR